MYSQHLETFVLDFFCNICGTPDGRIVSGKCETKIFIALVRVAYLR
ncbi:MAG: hypothetical protein VCB07_05290 [Gammaproteobacteria bacterium]